MIQTALFQHEITRCYVRVNVGLFGANPTYVFGSLGNHASDADLLLMSLLIAPAGWREVA